MCLLAASSASVSSVPTFTALPRAECSIVPALGQRVVVGADVKRVRTEMSLHVLAYNLKRVMRLLGIDKLLKALAT